MDLFSLNNSLLNNFKYDKNNVRINSGDILILDTRETISISSEFLKNKKGFIFNFPSIFIVEYFYIDGGVHLFNHWNASFNLSLIEYQIEIEILKKIKYNDLINFECFDCTKNYENVKSVILKNTPYILKINKILKGIHLRNNWVKKFNKFPILFYNYSNEIDYHGSYYQSINDGSITLDDYYNVPFENRQLEIYCKPTKNHKHKEYFYK